jgi:LuxR family maltose regulon positive regulatory protein
MASQGSPTATLSGPPADTGPPPGPVLLETKLHPPSLRSGLVPRERLVGQLSGRPPLTLVDAPAGWGKTTLLAEWRTTSGERTAWLALDRGDNDPRRFWAYVIEALRTVEPGVGANALALLRAPGAGVIDAALATLLNELCDLDQPVTLVLDDYHLVTNGSVHDGMSFLVEHLPPTLRLVVATRSDPPLPLARLRARGVLVEIRAAELRFSDKEAGALLSSVLGLALDGDDVARLQARTEGWAAGLCLAALSLQGRADTRGFIDDFAGDDRHIVDYLGSEVLAAQAVDVRDFLLQTSILDRLCGPVCDAVTNSTGSARILERIERANLFLVPLDTRRRWYRYHHLFGELLRHELVRFEPDLVPQLHRRASAWCRDAGLIDEAIRHAASAGDVAEAGELVARHWLLATDQGHQDTVFQWLDILPASAVAADARLCLAQAMTLLSVGRPEEAPAWIEMAERTEPQGPLWDGMSSIEAEAAFAWAMVGSMNGDLGSGTAAAQRALELVEDAASFWQTALAAITGAILYLSGRGAEAVPLLEKGIATDGTAGNGMSLAYALAFRAVMHAEADELEEAERRLARAVDLLARDEALQEHFAWYAVEAASGILHQRQGNLEVADAALERATELARRGGGLAQIAFCLVIRSSVRYRRGDRAGARQLAAEARNLVEACPDPGSLLPTRLAEAEHLLRANGAQASRPATRATDHPAVQTEALSERELAVLRLLASPLSLREIGAALYVSLNTVKTHTRALYRKLGASGRAEAVARAGQLGLG